LAWTINYTDTARGQLSKLDKQTARRILDYMDKRVSGQDNPRSSGKALTGPLGGLWRFRVDDYRIICDIQDEFVVILVLKIGHRGKVYDEH
jgi:mRNA interferase RelE/StbE